MAKTYTSKGKVQSDPDMNVMIKVTELASNLMGLIADANRRVKEPDSDEQRVADIEQIVQLINSTGQYEIKKVA
jgi:hypothetical protein